MTTSQGEPPQDMGNRDTRSSVAKAYGWVSRITALGLEMAIPALAGYYLDQKWGLTLFGPIGALLGFVVGFWHLLVLVKVVGKPPSGDGASNPKQDSGSD